MMTGLAIDTSMMKNVTMSLMHVNVITHKIKNEKYRGSCAFPQCLPPLHDTAASINSTYPDRQDIIFQRDVRTL